MKLQSMSFVYTTENPEDWENGSVVQNPRSEYAAGDCVCVCVRVVVVVGGLPVCKGLQVGV